MKYCVEWYGGNALCKVLMMVRTGGFILSSNLLVVLSIDRWDQAGVEKLPYTLPGLDTSASPDLSPPSTR